MSDQLTEPSAAPRAADSQINILAQYVRDISFENPLAPDSLRADNGNPKLDINIGVDARKVPDDKIDDMFETVISLRAVAQHEGDNPTFILEMLYGVTVVLKDIPEDNHHPVLMIEIPRLAFPYIRQIVSDLTQQAGFPALLLNPVDFQQLYMRRYKDEIEAAQKKAAGNADDKKTKSSKKANAKDKTES